MNDKIKRYNYIAVDFDGTLCEHKFPEIGEPIPAIIEFIKDHQARGSKIILHTCREDALFSGRQYLTEALEWCERHKIHFDAVNSNPWVDFYCRKVYADIYIDDRGVNAWEIARWGAEGVLRCRKCGCTNVDGCFVGCEWVEYDLCSACVG